MSELFNWHWHRNITQTTKYNHYVVVSYSNHLIRLFWFVFSSPKSLNYFEILFGVNIFSLWVVMYMISLNPQHDNYFLPILISLILPFNTRLEWDHYYRFSDNVLTRIIHSSSPGDHHRWIHIITSLYSLVFALVLLLGELVLLLVLLLLLLVIGSFLFSYIRLCWHKLSSGNVIAHETEYHPSCLAAV